MNRAVWNPLLRCAPFVLLLCLSAGVAAAAPKALPGLEPWTEGLALLHSSRTDEALDTFLALGSRRPDDVCGFYFPALVYIHFNLDGLSDEEESEHGRTFLNEGIELGQQRIDDKRADSSTRYCTGALYGLRAEYRLRQSKMLGTALDAKRVRRIMLDLLEDEPECIDCRFWTGSYDYYADVIPGMIKFFRTLLFFPKGNKERGLATLQEVAEHGRIDRYTTLWTLYSLYRELEKDPRLALATLERLHAAYPEDIDVWLTLAQHRFAVTDPPDRARGIAILLEALAHVQAHEGDRGTRLTARVRNALTHAYLADLQPDKGIEAARPSVEATRGHEEREIDATRALLRALIHAGRYNEARRGFNEIEQRYPESPMLEPLQELVDSYDETSSRTFHLAAAAWRRGREGETDPADRDFRSLLDDEHSPGLVHFVQAEMYRDLGNAAKAEGLYRRAVEQGIERPRAFLPLAYVRLGNLADLRDDRSAAKRNYRAAADNAGDQEWAHGVAKYYLKEPFTGEGGIRFP